MSRERDPAARLSWMILCLTLLLPACLEPTGREPPPGLATPSPTPKVTDLPSPESLPDLGGDERLNHLARLCSEGDLVNCDLLVLASQPGSNYEAYGGTCGGRIEEPLDRCAERFAPTFSADLSAKEGGAQGTPSGVLVAARMASHEGFDRFVLEFAEGGLPAYRVSYLQETSVVLRGDAVPVEGGALLSAEVTPASTMDPAGDRGYEGPVRLRAPATLNIIEAALREEEAATMSWVLALNERTGFEVFTLTDPPRLVIDVSQR